MSKIKIAFIPPNGMQSYVKQGDMVMALAQRLMTTSGEPNVKRIDELLPYADEMFTIMDNGAAENEQLGDDDLASVSQYLGTNELVLPDQLGDSAQTLKKVQEYLRRHTARGMRYMAVVQGSTGPQIHALIEDFAKIESITTIGIPRLLLRSLGSRSIRLDVANWIQEYFPNRFQIHCLGASSAWLKEPYYLRKYAPHIRSMDTSLPFNYGLKGISIDNTSQQIERPLNYFTANHFTTDKTAIGHNVQIYKSWCSGYAKTASSR